MLNTSGQKKLLTQSLPNHQVWRRSLASLILVSLLTVGCTQKAPTKLNLNLSVQPANRPGIYQVTGATNLPEGTVLSIAAIRYFRSPELTGTSSAAVDSYAILARQLVKVEQGTWQANLNLWEVAPDGSYVETWQKNPLTVGLPLVPSSEVAFVALLEPTNQIPELRKALDAQQGKMSTNLLRYTNEGNWYLRASENIAISLPLGKTTPPVLTSKDINGGWGDRSLIISENYSNSILPSATISQSDAPMSPEQFMR